MAEYIERERIRKALVDACLMNQNCPMFIAAKIDQMIDCEPAADVAPVVHAHWYMRGGRACCSNCNVKSLWKSDWDGCKNHEREFVSAKSNYCPHCGAKMDKKIIHK